MNKTREETGLAQREQITSELAPTAHAAAVQAEVQAAIIIAKRFPRNEDLAYEKLMKACKRTSFAEDAIYSYPRGGTDIEGPSVNIAREAARVWGNIEYGATIIRDEEDERHIRGVCWDKETNSRNYAEASFKKLIFRKKGGWVIPDERELRELTNKHAAILERNAILKTIPKDFIEDALNLCRATLKTEASQDPDGARKRLILAFSELNVTPEMLEKRLGHDLAKSSPAELADLRKIFASIRDGNSTWSDHQNPDAPPANEGSKAPASEKGRLSMNDLKAPKAEEATSKILSPDEARRVMAMPPMNEAPEPEAPKPQTVACDRSDFDQLEILATDHGVTNKKWKKHIQETMGFASWDLLTADRLEEVQKWIRATATRNPD